VPSDVRGFPHRFTGDLMEGLVHRYPLASATTIALPIGAHQVEGLSMQVDIIFKRAGHQRREVQTQQIFVGFQVKGINHRVLLGRQAEKKRRTVHTSRRAPLDQKQARLWESG